MAESCPILHRAHSYTELRAVLEGDDYTVACPDAEGDSPLDTTALASDGPRHTAIHRIWSTWFSTAQVDARRASLLEPVVATTWRRLQGQGRVDIVTSFAGEVAPRVIFSMIGLPQSVGVEVYRSSIVPITRFREDHAANRRDALVAHARLVETLSEYHHVLCPSGRVPADLTTAEFLDALAVVLQLATETTVCAVANVFYLIAEYPDTWAAVVANQLTARCFVEEVIRFEPPSARKFRFAKVGSRLPSGLELPRHAAVALNFHEANMTDPHLVAPHRWSPGAGRGTGASFGLGKHACAGRGLALALLVEIR